MALVSVSSLTAILIPHLDNAIVLYSTSTPPLLPPPSSSTKSASLLDSIGLQPNCLTRQCWGVQIPPDSSPRNQTIEVYSCFRAKFWTRDITSAIDYPSPAPGDLPPTCSLPGSTCLPTASTACGRKPSYIPNQETAGNRTKTFFHALYLQLREYVGDESPGAGEG